MAEALTEHQALVAPDAAKPPEPGFRRRFRLAYAGLAAVIAISAVALVVVLTRSGHTDSGPWSRWQPQTSASLDRAGEIAAHVGPLYRLSDGKQLAAVQAHPAEVQNQPQNVPVEAIAVRGGISGQDIHVDGTGSSIFYILCGLGDNCEIASGQPSQERAILLRREALELALYTFKYGGGVDSVVTFLPPATLPTGEKDVSWALYFKRRDFARQLSRPLARTLPPRSPLTPDTLTRSDGASIDSLTTPRAYTTSFTAAPDGGAVLVLDPLSNTQ